jgi:hypothetical protein
MRAWFCPEANLRFTGQDLEIDGQKYIDRYQALINAVTGEVKSARSSMSAAD